MDAVGVIVEKSTKWVVGVGRTIPIGVSSHGFFAGREGPKATLVAGCTSGLNQPVIGPITDRPRDVCSTGNGVILKLAKLVLIMIDTVLDPGKKLLWCLDRRCCRNRLEGIIVRN